MLYSACYDVALHPTLDVLITTSRDSTARVWDMRTKACVHVLAGHTDGIPTVMAQVCINVHIYISARAYNYIHICVYALSRRLIM